MQTFWTALHTENIETLPYNNNPTSQLWNIEILV